MKKLMMILIVLAITSVGLTAMLIWDPSPSVGILGYKIHRGDVSRKYTETTDVGDALEFPIDDKTGYFAATAYTADKESTYSNEVKAEELTAWIVSDGTCAIFYRPDSELVWTQLARSSSGEYKVIVYTQVPEVTPPVIKVEE